LARSDAENDSQYLSDLSYDDFDDVQNHTKDTSLQKQINGQTLEPKKSDNSTGNDHDMVVTQKIVKEVEEVEECGCPLTNKIKRLMRVHGQAECRPSNCTNYELDISELEKPDLPFERYDGVVMVTKVLWPDDIRLLQQMICTFNAAYNRHAGYYDIVVFTSKPFIQPQIDEIQRVAFPANLSVVVDTPPLKDVLASMTEEEVLFLKERCGCCSDNQSLSWMDHCTEKDGHTVNLGYAWQSEFRTYHIWKHPILAKYKYMIWMDSDAISTKMWNRDPMKIMTENNLVVMYDHWPNGQSDEALLPKIMKAYNQSLCHISEDGGHFNSTPCTMENPKVALGLIHGYHHITNMNFYRSERTMRFLKILVEDYRFTRKFDDQVGVTIPVALDAPHRAWAHHKHGLNFSIHHNGLLNGDVSTPNAQFGYHKYHWKRNRKEWVTGAKMCNPWITQRG